MKAVTKTRHYDAIAREIHELAGHKRKSSYKPSELVEGVRAVSSYQYEDGYYWGYTEGEEQGYNDGIDVGYNSGHKKGYNEGRESFPDADLISFPDASITEKVVTDSKYYDEIAERIQVYGEAKTYTPAQMPDAIDDIVNNAREMGKFEGYQSGYGNGLTEGEAQGRQAQYDEFWDSATNNNTRTSYRYAFAGTSWNDATFKPPYQLKPIIAERMFANYSQITKLYKSQADFSQATNMVCAFGFYSELEYIEEINVTSATDVSQMFRYASSLKTIDKLILKSVENGGTTFDNQAFYRCPDLANINVIEGCMDGTTISFADSSKLSSASVDNIIGALKQLETGATAKTLTLHEDVTVSNEQKALITQKGWSLVQ